MKESNSTHEHGASRCADNDEVLVCKRRCALAAPGSVQSRMQGVSEHCVIKKNASQLVRTTEIDYNLKRKGLFLMWNCTTSFLGGADSSDGHAP